MKIKSVFTLSRINKNIRGGELVTQCPSQLVQFSQPV